MSTKIPYLKSPLTTTGCILLGLFFLFISSLANKACAQQSRTITGKINDAQTGEPIPYVTVSVKLIGGTRKAASSDFDGNYHLIVPRQLASDSIYASYVGYLTGSKTIPQSGNIEINFKLTVNAKSLKTVNITPKAYENPAWEIMRNVVKHKPDNDLQKLQSYQYKSYNRITLSASNLSEKMKSRRVMRDILPLMDSLKKLNNDEGSPVLPIFMSETISNYYYQTNPDRKSEHVERSKSVGVGIEDESLISQLVGTTFLQYNFYKNYLRLANKDFISPLTDSWRTFYNYELIDDNDKINGKAYYKIEFKPKRAHDLSFSGTMWITKDDYALYRINTDISPDANLNFLNGIRIQQEMHQPQGTTAWLPTRTRIVLHISSVKKDWTGFIATFYLSNGDFEVNKNYPDDIFKEPVILADDVNKKDESYWDKNRRDTLTAADKNVYKMIDTVKKMPIIKTYTSIAGTLINGYYKLGKISLGPYPYTYSHNDLQGSVIRLGGITNSAFSNKIILGAWASFGFSDHRLSGNASVDYIFSRKPWVQGGLSYTHDIAQTGYQYENYAFLTNNVFTAALLNGTISKRGPFIENVSQAYIQSDITSNLLGRVFFKYSTFDPLFNFDYRDITDSENLKDYQTAEVRTELQWTPGRRQLQSSKINKRISINGGTDAPILTFRYTHGIKQFGGDFTYNKLGFNLQQKVHMGIFGRGDYSFIAGYIPSTLPYPLLENHRFNFNTMRFLEYTSDRYFSLTYTQHMEGLITNSIPLLKALNLRTVAVVNILDGSLTAANNEGFARGRRRVNLSLNSEPYVELGYGLENILKIIRIDFMYRMTHTDHIDNMGNLPDRFAPRLTLQFRL
ncbi:DUF5686 and carboxypeptidase regulatory-like domain-containing protein [Mucilaginibacter sp. HMF5004]|uniref:DUF5686 and carboxypeptidase-like regulatory domain-containing protein n=1 Tax=Mucilaginibacter rivuli TaxID=2857527 RepID=UPI001C606FCB|nr:DUF5686 and carboxypeptidase-like regulatory domain-containing protein [Mucilaginibacter rivuli]MBW4889179.1 DUF5686 and carboxypeptidase regulatory-like domain-containing protein [Mucilaginibacter rivuli]